MTTSGGSATGLPYADPRSGREARAHGPEVARRRRGYWLLASTVVLDVVGFLLVWGTGDLGSSVQDVAVVAAMTIVVISWACSIAAIWMLFRVSTPWTVIAVLLCLAQLLVVLVAWALTRIYFDPNWLNFEY